MIFIGLIGLFPVFGRKRVKMSEKSGCYFKLFRLFSIWASIAVRLGVFRRPFGRQTESNRASFEKRFQLVDFQKVRKEAFKIKEKAQQHEPLCLSGEIIKPIDSGV